MAYVGSEEAYSVTNAPRQLITPLHIWPSECVLRIGQFQDRPPLFCFGFSFQ